MDYLSNSVEQTQKIAAQIAQQLQNKGGIIALIGDLGAGKTTFVQGFAQGLGIREKIISPTFVLIRQHQLPNSEHWLFHLDLYRLADNTSIAELGLKDILAEEKNIVLIEWAQKVLDQLPDQTIKINLQKISPTERKINVVWPE